jgi:pyruvate/2-oxoglutarate dehydrogenase complex dihydrolipoamide acyltransferase (E2) component
MTRDDRSIVRDMIKTAVDKRFQKIEDDLKDLKKDAISKSDVIDIMIDAYVKQHKFMWEKSKFITSYFKNL